MKTKYVRRPLNRRTRGSFLRAYYDNDIHALDGFVGLGRAVADRSRMVVCGRTMNARRAAVQAAMTDGRSSG